MIYKIGLDTLKSQVEIVYPKYLEWELIPELLKLNGLNTSLEELTDLMLSLDRLKRDENGNLVPSTDVTSGIKFVMRTVISGDESNEVIMAPVHTQIAIVKRFRKLKNSYR